MKNAPILVVEDDPTAARYMVLALEERFMVRTAANGAEAVRVLESGPHELVFMDLALPDIHGLDLLTLFKRRRPEVPVIMVTAADDAPTIVEAVRRGAINYLVKPVSPATLLGAAQKALEVPPPPYPSADPVVPEMVGTSKAMGDVLRLLALAARSDVNVLLVGETGTGKELAARAIHRLSGRHRGPFVPHNCATTSPELFDSEFFGHRRGAFTGAERDHAGLLSRANGGVIFLDELESMGLGQQAKLLRVLDDGEVRPVGSSETQVVNVRFLAATNRASATLIREGALREDLYYRLLGFEIDLPPLRDRPEDMPALAAHFLGSDAARLTVAALEVLGAAAWPGNVRQLRNVLVASRARAGDGRIDAHHLTVGPGPCSAPAPSSPTAGSMREQERDAIARALRESNGNRSLAARNLGIDRSTLRRKLQERPE